MDDLVQFLRDRYDEDEQAAQAADPGLGNLLSQVEYLDDEVQADQRHIARHNPARVLRDIEAKRQAVGHVAKELEDSGSGNPWWYADRLTPILKALALPYADHPDYREDWRP